MSIRKILSYDEEIDQYISEVVCGLKACGIKNPSKADALRVIIKRDQASKLRFKRKPKSKDGVLFF
jgi:hypothetical protein